MDFEGIRLSSLQWHTSISGKYWANMVTITENVRSFVSFYISFWQYIGTDQNILLMIDSNIPNTIQIMSNSNQYNSNANINIKVLYIT